MTATVDRTRKPVKPNHRGRNYVECPVCGIPTGSLTHHGFSGFRTVLLATASGYEDGARCKDHARSVALRCEQSEAAMAWIRSEDIESQLVHE